MSEIAAIEEQLNGVEKYAMYFLEEETAEYAAEQLRLAEVSGYMDGEIVCRWQCIDQLLHGVPLTLPKFSETYT